MAGIFGDVEAPSEAPAVEGNVETPVDNGVETPQSWMNDVPEEYRESSFVQKYGDDKDAFFSGMNNLFKMQSSKRSGVPDFESADADVVNEFRDQLGVPHDSNEYKINLPEGYQTNDSFDSFRSLLHKGHVPNDVANDLFQMGQAEITATKEAIKNSIETENTQAIEEFKTNPRFDEIDINAGNLLAKVDPNGEIFSVQEVQALGKHAPKVLMLLDRISSLTNGDTIPKAGGTVGSATREERINKSFKDQEAGLISPPNGMIQRENINKELGL